MTSPPITPEYVCPDCGSAVTSIEDFIHPPLDKDVEIDEGIENEVRVLRARGIETTSSCEGGKGHSYTEPTICFHGERAQGFRVYAIAVENGLRVDCIRRVWDDIDGELSGPYWEIVFWNLEDRND